jgi:glutaredoxin
VDGGQLTEQPHDLFVRHACDFCAEAEALLQAEGITYRRVVVRDAARPGEVDLVYPDGRVERRRVSRFLQTPMLVDREAGATLVGLEAIERHLEVL